MDVDVKEGKYMARCCKKALQARRARSSIYPEINPLYMTINDLGMLIYKSGNYKYSVGSLGNGDQDGPQSVPSPI